MSKHLWSSRCQNIFDDHNPAELNELLLLASLATDSLYLDSLLLSERMNHVQFPTLCPEQEFFVNGQQHSCAIIHPGGYSLDFRVGNCLDNILFYNPDYGRKYNSDYRRDYSADYRGYYSTDCRRDYSSVYNLN
ncbi:hypothetical protein FF38_00935 [Lucilia cuprina]|uniref:Uncharacterized protein n=1 Tax=Lucilia cuprina TaxID=7375 RepID=A0A0L0BQI1_LUCCU|nr:hypothetical protein FF38_00935 [Lucilia cuprina]